jgi:hypothetical protein
VSSEFDFKMGFFPLRRPDLQGALGSSSEVLALSSQGKYGSLILVATGDYHDAFAPGAEQTPGWWCSAHGAGQTWIKVAGGSGRFTAWCGLLRQNRYMMRQAGGGEEAPMTTMSLIPGADGELLLFSQWHGTLKDNSEKVRMRKVALDPSLTCVLGIS